MRNVWYYREDCGTEFIGVVSAPFHSTALNLKSLKTYEMLYASIFQGQIVVMDFFKKCGDLRNLLEHQSMFNSCLILVNTWKQFPKITKGKKNVECC